MHTELILATCVAVREGRLQDARTAFSSLVADTPDTDALQAMGDCLFLALRRQEYALLGDWLAEAQPRLLHLAGQGTLCEQMAVFLQRLAFGVSDRRIVTAQTTLVLLLRRWLCCDVAAPVLKAFWNEWISLVARMARRGWREQAHLLLCEALRWLLKQHDRQLWGRWLLQLELHFVVYAGWDGFAKACSAYVELPLLYSLLLRRSQKARADAEQAMWLQLLLRHMRSVVANSARAAMTGEMEIFRQWYSFFWQLAGADKRKKRQLHLLLQLAISYWQQTMPKTSRKQTRFLEDLLQPSLIDEHYAGLLRMIG
jgi:hypothetical protein